MGIMFHQAVKPPQIDRYKEIIGRHVNRDIDANKTLFWEDLVK